MKAVRRLLLDPGLSEPHSQLVEAILVDLGLSQKVIEIVNGLHKLPC